MGTRFVMGQGKLRSRSKRSSFDVVRTTWAFFFLIIGLSLSLVAILESFYVNFHRLHAWLLLMNFPRHTYTHKTRTFDIFALYSSLSNSALFLLSRRFRAFTIFFVGFCGLFDGLGSFRPSEFAHFADSLFARLTAARQGRRETVRREGSLICFLIHLLGWTLARLARMPGAVAVALALPKQKRHKQRH